MGEDAQRCRPRVLIAGGGVAALEATLALRDLAGSRIDVELCSSRGEFIYRPFAVGEPYGATRVIRFDLDSLVGQIGASFHLGGIFSVDLGAGVATTRDGEQIRFDYLVVATGARMLSAVPGSVAFWGVADEGGVSGVVRRLRAGTLRSVAFTMPAGGSWALPLYELALLGSAVLAKSGIEDARLTVVTPEDAPLLLFGRSAAEQMTRLMSEHGIEVITGTLPVEFDGERLRVTPGDPIETDAVVSLPRLEGRRVDGLPHDEDGFLPVDRHCGVVGAERIFAAGDVTSFPVKRNEVATREADTAAEAIAAAVGCDVEPAPFEWADTPLPSGHDGKIAGRYLTPFLAVQSDARKRTPAPGRASRR
jgi:sulfide:quinone oxidoreductase